MKTMRKLFVVMMLGVMVFCFAGCSAVEANITTKISSDSSHVSIYTNHDCSTNVTITTSTEKVLTIKDISLDSDVPTELSIEDFYMESFGNAYVENNEVNDTIVNTTTTKPKMPASHSGAAITFLGGMLICIIVPYIEVRKMRKTISHNDCI